MAAGGENAKAAHRRNQIQSGKIGILAINTAWRKLNNQ